MSNKEVTSSCFQESEITIEPNVVNDSSLFVQNLDVQNSINSVQTNFSDTDSSDLNSLECSSCEELIERNFNFSNKNKNKIIRKINYGVDSVAETKLAEIIDDTDSDPSMCSCIQDYDKTAVNVDIFSTELYNQFDVIYGKIAISNVAKLIINHEYFQRLKKIKQLGVIYFKFPHANHTVFEHSIGVTYLARYTSTLLMYKHDTITDKELLCLEIAGLCHNLGCGAYNHIFDQFLDEMKFNYKTACYKSRSQILVEYLIKDLDGVYDCIINDEDISLIQYFIHPDGYNILFPKKKLPNFTKGLDKLISNTDSGIDLNRLDYLIRDSRSLDIDSSAQFKNDILGLLSRSILDDNIAAWAIHIRDKNTIYELLCKRYIIYNSYYLNSDVNSLNCMIKDALRCVNQSYNFTNCAKLDTLKNIEQYLHLTDDYFLEFILNSKNPKILMASSLMQRIIECNEQKNKLYKYIGDNESIVNELDETKYIESICHIFTEKTSPDVMLSKIKYHKNGLIINLQELTHTRKLYLKT